MTQKQLKNKILHILFLTKQKLRHHPIKTAIAVLCFVWYAFCLPRQLFPQPYATVLESSEGKLLGAKIANDGQWRFPEVDSVPYRFKMSVLQFEDAHFYYHWGV
ncbi:MAG: penicillin-binding protein 1C, partial [Capnocytophaga ochracea]